MTREVQFRFNKACLYDIRVCQKMSAVNMLLQTSFVCDPVTAVAATVAAVNDNDGGDDGATLFFPDLSPFSSISLSGIFVNLSLYRRI